MMATVLSMPDGPRISRLLMVIVLEAVLELMVMVLVLTPLVMVFMELPLVGRPCDQLALVPQLLEELLIQLLVVSTAKAAGEKRRAPMTMTNIVIALDCDVGAMVTYPK